MSKGILQDIISDFEVNKFTNFFRQKNRFFQPKRESLSQYDDEFFSEGIKFGEVSFDNEARNLIICAFYSIKSLSERSGKKAQYEKAKKILKEIGFDGGIFIFYDKSGNFRFSLIYANYMGKHRDWSTFRRFTYFVGKELTNKTFLQRIGNSDFTSLKKIKEAFSVEKVTKEFYDEIAHWYFWAVEHSCFPKDAQIEENGKNVAVIRLITRMIFIWFMRERGLVPKELFEERNIKQVLKNISPDSSTYYRAILQNLFFATLNTKKEERQFRSEKRFYKGWNKDFGIQYVFRYHDLFADPEKMEEYFGNIPFLNGGLFDCLDDGRNDIYIDGFTERNKEYQPEVPNFLFFSRERKVDLNSYYGTKNKVYKTQGLLNILSSFNFTIDENSPDDADIALDPELLGRVFENLLASFNPETSTTARKATGSYYTPREIVDYMVTESLKAYFKTHLQTVQIIEEKLDNLFSTESEENPFSKAESKKLVELIESVRIVDPAVGSGAFPMGALNKMVFILSKVDSGNELWKQAQLIAAETIPDPQVRRATKNQIEEFFKDKNADYGRKLYLIQKCIYGVDIQHIAVEIAKLRFFISLLVDEKIDKGKENWGIEPLPNLDFKIMQGNSLISEFFGIDFDNGQTKQEQAGVLFIKKEDKLIKEFEQKKIDFQNESDKDRKAKLKNEIEDLMIKIFETKIKKQKADYFRQMEDIKEKYAAVPNKKMKDEIIDKEKRKLSRKAGFDLENIEKQLREFTSKNKNKPFFAWKLYFVEVFEKGGFDVVIANPPYVRIFKQGQNNETKDAFKRLYISAYKDYDYYVLFLEKGINILKPNGVLVYITPDKYLVREYGKKIRELLLTYSIKELFDLSRATDIFKAATYPLISIIQKNDRTNKIKVKIARTVHNLKRNYKEISLSKQQCITNDRIEITDPEFNILIHKIFSQARRLSDILNSAQIFCGTPRAKDYHLWSKYIGEKQKKNCLRVLVCSNLTPYAINFGKKVRVTGLSISSPYFCIKDEIISKTRWQDFQFVPKILIRGNDKRITAVLDEDGSVFIGIYGIKIENNILRESKTLLACLNSTLYQWIFAIQNPSIKIGGDFFSINAPHILRLPFKQPDKKQRDEIDRMVDKILAITKDNTYLESFRKQAKLKEYEHQIDQMIYKLYNLTDEEIRIIEEK